MIDPRARVQQQPDVVERTMREAIIRDGPLFRVVRLVKNGPLCPSAILYVQTRMEPGTDNDMTGTRSPFIAAFVSGEPVDPPRLFASGKAGSGRISRAEYAMAVAEIAANRRAGRHDPRSTPYKPVDLSQMEIPFARQA